MSMKSLDDIIRTVKKRELQTLSVAVAQDNSVLTAVDNAYNNKIIKDAILVEIKEKLKR